MKYLVEYITADGARRSEAVSCDNSSDASFKFESAGHFVVSVAEAQGASSNGVRFSFFNPRPSLFDLMLFTRELNTLIKAGVPLPSALSLIEEHAPGKSLLPLIAGVREDVVAGISFSEAVSKRVPYFPEVYARCISGGETSSNLTAVLDLLADNLKKSYRLSARFFNILIYPAVVIAIASIVLAFLIVYVVPAFEKVFLEMRIETPYYTAFFFRVSSFFRNNLAYVIAAIILFPPFFFAAGLAETLKRKFYSIAVGLPGIGPIIRGYSLFLFSGMLSILLRSGVPAVDSLSAASAAIERISGGRRISEALDALKNGAPLSSAISLLRLSDEAVVRMGAVGERSGRVPEMLEAVNNYYSEIVENGIERLSSIVEPIVIFLLGIFMAAVILSIFLPLIRITMAGF